MHRYFSIFLIIILGFFLFVLLVLATGYGKINCNTFLGGQRNNKIVGCGFGRSTLMNFGETTEKAFVGYGILKGVSYKNDKILLKIVIPWGGIFSFQTNVELDKRLDGKYDICQEKLKRWGLFDCSGVLKFTKEEAPVLLNEIRGREIVFVYNNNKSGRFRDSWQKMLDKKNIFEYFFLMVRGLLQQNNLYAYMVGY